MAVSKVPGIEIVGISTTVPSTLVDNERDARQFELEEVKKIVELSGVKQRHVADDTQCSSDLCVLAATRLLGQLKWDRSSVGALIMVTQTPDYIMPSTACIIHERLGLSADCAAFDVNLGCSGYPYGLWLASLMLSRPGVDRALVLMGETPSRVCDKSDHTVALLFGDAGSATAVERNAEKEDDWIFSLHTDGKGYRDFIVEGGGVRKRFPEEARDNYIRMNGAGIFNFTLKRVPSLVRDTLAAGSLDLSDIDYVIIHQANLFMMKHLSKKANLPQDKVPIIIDRFGNTGGASLPLTITQGGLRLPQDRRAKLLLLGFGIGLSWASAIVDVRPEVILEHAEL
jgi:3-oxoacyl-[acyl-carrier-protein] synthase III